MARNIEIKAALPDMRRQQELATDLCEAPGVSIHQVDTFFRCEHGRLKLRTFDDGSGELIYYCRPDQTGPKLSEYAIVPVPDPPALEHLLGVSNGTLATVEKTRLLFLHGQTRIHLDEVVGLGSFAELEVVLETEQSVSHGQRVAEELMAALEIEPSKLVELAYVDLLSAMAPS